MEAFASSSFESDSSASRFRSADGLALAGSLLQRPGRQVSLAHGFGQTRQSWLATQARLADAGFGSLAWDMRGHGQSERNPATSPYAAEQFIADQIAAAAQLDDPLPVLVGASMGGLTGLMAQAEHRLFSALVLVDVTPRWEAAGMQRIRSFMGAFPEGFESFEHAADAIANYLPQRRERKTPAQLTHLLKASHDQRLRWHWDSRLLSEFVDRSQQLQDILSAAAGKIDVPVLLISGGRSDLVSDDTVAHFLQLVPQAEHVRLADATHMLAGDDNDSFSDTLLAFLRAQFPHSASVSELAVSNETASGRPDFESTAPGVSR
jgi:pimeloyl-ACP methyl ester carboxylesterase